MGDEKGGEGKSKTNQQTKKHRKQPKSPTHPTPLARGVGGGGNTTGKKGILNA